MNVIVVLFSLMVVGVLVAALLAGGTEKKKNILLWSGLGALISALCGTIMLFQQEAIKDIVLQKIPESLLLQLGFKIPFSFMLLAGTAVFLTGIILFLLAFNCRKNSSKWYWALLWSAGIALLLGHILFMPTFYGFGSWIEFFGLTPESGIAKHAMPFFTQYGCFLISALLWTWHTLKTAKNSWKNILSFAGCFTVFAALLWLSAAGVGIWAKHFVAVKAAELDITPFTVTDQTPPEFQKQADRDFYTRHAKYNPPRSGRYIWGKDTIPADEKEYTMKFFTSPELEAHLTNLQKRSTYLGQKNVLYLSAAQAFRSLVRHRADIAELYVRTGQTEKAMAEFMKYPDLDALIPRDTPFLINELVRNATRHLWVEALIKYGPEDKIYLPHYRKFLEWSKSWQVHLPCEAGFVPPEKSLGAIAGFFYAPYLNTLRYRQFSEAINRIPELKKLEQQEVITDDSMFADAAKRLREGVVSGRTALALKLYKIEHGRFPQKLSELIPRYLPQEYVSPYTGKKLNCTVNRDPASEFTLSAEKITITSRRN